MSTRTDRVSRIFPADSALDLAIFRVVVAYVILTTGLLWDLQRWAALAPAMRVAPFGFGWIAARVPIDVRAAVVARALLVVALLFGLVGFRARIAFGVVAVLGVYVFGIPQLGGSVWHMHHLLWFSALLAASPCSDALSLDAWIARRAGKPVQNAPSVAYGAPLTFARVLIALVFFFPGVWKLREAGVGWAWSDNLRNLMWSKWFQTGGWSWWQRIDRFPSLVRLCACAAIVFEVSFLPLVFVRRARTLLLVVALSFHAFTSLFLRIEFSTLWWCYVVFVDWQALKPRFFSSETHAVGSRRATMATVVVGSMLVAVAGVFGVRGIVQGWPFACYPTFQYLTPADIVAIDIEAVNDDGSIAAIPRASSLDRSRAQQMWGVEWNVVRRTPSDEATLRGYLDVVARTSSDAASRIRTARSIRFYRAWYSTNPDDGDRPPLHRVFIGEIRGN